MFDFGPVARKDVPPAHFGYMASGIDDEVTLRANREGFLKFQLRPRRLNDVSKWIGNMNALRRRLPRPRPRSPRHKVPDSDAERRRSRMPQRSRTSGARSRTSPRVGPRQFLR
jgi:4-hydroxymandelate oxidase